MTLRDRWETHANAWIDWARTPGHDSYWRHHRDQFLRIVPAAGELTIDSVAVKVASRATSNRSAIR